MRVQAESKRGSSSSAFTASQVTPPLSREDWGLLQQAAGDPVPSSENKSLARQIKKQLSSGHKGFMTGIQSLGKKGKGLKIYRSVNKAGDGAAMSPIDSIALEQGRTHSKVRQARERNGSADGIAVAMSYRWISSCPPPRVKYRD